MRRTTLTEEQRASLQAARHDRTLTPHERDRVEMLLLSAAGWSPPRIAMFLACATKTVRQLLDRFPSEGLDALRRKRPGPPPNGARREQITATLRVLLAQDRTWTAGQLTAALGEHGIRLGTRQVRRYLRGMDARYKRTVRTLAHKQDPARVATARQTLGALKRGQKRAASRSPISMNVALPPVSR
jgi:transposase